MGNIVARSKRKIEEKWRSNFRIDVVGFNRTWILDEYVGCGGLPVGEKPLDSRSTPLTEITHLFT